MEKICHQDAGLLHCRVIQISGLSSITILFLPGKMVETRTNTSPEWKDILKEGKIGYINNLIEKHYNNRLFAHDNRLTFIMDLDKAKRIIYGLAIPQRMRPALGQLLL
jgi:hypothetical protein